MADHQSHVTVPPDLRKRYPELIELILGSESMNDEERQYWINILPVMTPEQIENLNQILGNEKRQLAAIDAKYSREMARLGRDKSPEDLTRLRRARREERLTKECRAQEEEEGKEEAILQEIAGLED